MGKSGKEGGKLYEKTNFGTGINVCNLHYIWL